MRSMSQHTETESGEPLPDFLAILPDRIWYLTTNGTDMWCRRPYGFFFTSSEAALAFSGRMGTEFALSPIGVGSKELVSKEGIEAMRRMSVTRIFVDPLIDEESGDVHGKILRIAQEGQAGAVN